MSLLIVRLVVFVLLFWAGFRIWQYWQAKQQLLGEKSSSQNNDGSEIMVRCEKCQIHLPQGNAIKAGEYYFCCQEHQESFEKE